MSSVLLIGGEGYIGNIVSLNLLKEGYKVCSYDNLLYKNNNCVLYKITSNNYNFVYGDILDSYPLENEIIKADAVVLLAGLVGDPITKSFPKAASLINDLGVRNVINLCSKHQIEKFIFISTCSNYGLINSDKTADENFPLNPLSLYAKSKVTAEKYILSLKDKTKMHPTILRFATAFGLSPRMRFDLTINEFTRDIANGKELQVYDAKTWRPYCHVQDFAFLIQKVIEAPVRDSSFQVFNVGGKKNNATKQMIVNFIMNRFPNGKVKYLEKRNQTRNYKVNFGKVKQVFGFEPKFSIEDGIDELIQLINKNVFDIVDQNLDFFGNYTIDYKDLI